VIWLLSYIHSAYIHSWHDINIWKIQKSFIIPHLPMTSVLAARVSSAISSFKFPLYDTMAVYSKQSFLMCSQTIFPCLFRGFFPSDLDYNISYTDPSYLEQNSGRWKMPSKVGNIALILWWKSHISKPNLAGKQSCEKYEEGMLQYGNKFAPQKIFILCPMKYVWFWWILHFAAEFDACVNKFSCFCFVFACYCVVNSKPDVEKSM
jgi:hypothetical protein